MSHLNLALYAVMAPGNAANFKARLFGDRLLGSAQELRNTLGAISLFDFISHHFLRRGVEACFTRAPSGQ